MLTRIAVPLLLLLLSACAPRLQEIGPPIDLPLRVWEPWDRPAEAVILALHGFNDYSKGFASPGKGMARRGFIFYAFDQRGFGQTPQRGIWAGEKQMADDL